MCFTICNRLEKLLVDPLQCSVWCSNKTKGTQRWDCRLRKQCFLNRASDPGDVLLLGCFTTCRKTRLTRDARYYTKHISCLQTVWNISIRQFKTFKSYPAFELSYIKRRQKWWLKPAKMSQKTFWKMSCYKTMTVRLMHIKQFTEAFQWDGKY